MLFCNQRLRDYKVDEREIAKRYIQTKDVRHDNVADLGFQVW